MLATSQPQATANELMRLWEQDGLQAVCGRPLRADIEYSALLERVQLLEQENAVLQRQVQLFRDLAALD
jgi:hypothetical protein